MSLPRVRLTITPAEFRLLKPGLDLLVNGLTTANLGVFPDRYPWLYRVSTYPNRSFDAGMAERIIAVHQKLLDLTCSRKVRFDLFELSASALALRLLDPRPTEPGPKDRFDALYRKLEIHRRRARRAALRHLSDAEFDDANRRWKHFVQWCRFNLVNPPVNRPATLWWRQRHRLADHIRKTIAERCYAALSEDQMKRVVRLLKEEFNRGRHPVRLPTLLAGEESSRRLLFTLVAKKVPLTPLPGTQLPYVIAASQRADKFKAAMARRRATGMAVESTGPVIETAGKPGSSTTSPRITTPTDVDLIEGIVSWLEANVPREHWQSVINLAAQQALDFPIIHRNRLTARTLVGVVAETRPHQHDFNLPHPQDLVCYFASWLLSWIYVYRLSQSVIRAILEHAYYMAVKNQTAASAAA